MKSKPPTDGELSSKSEEKPVCQDCGSVLCTCNDGFEGLAPWDCYT